MVKGLWIAGSYLTVLIVSYIILQWLNLTFRERLAMPVDLAVTGTAMFEPGVESSC